MLYLDPHAERSLRGTLVFPYEIILSIGIESLHNESLGNNREVYHKIYFAAPRNNTEIHYTGHEPFASR